MSQTLTFNNNSQKEHLINKLQIGQVIRAVIKEKTAPSKYILLVDDIPLIAASEIDLLSKSVWLKLIQKTPIIKLQLIIEENSEIINSIFSYAISQNLPIISIPSNLSQILNTLSLTDKPADLYRFIKWFSKRFSWGDYHDQALFDMINKGVSIKDIVEIFDSIDMNEHIISKISIVNNIINDTFYKLMSVDTHYSETSISIPIETFNHLESNILLGTVKTTHYGYIPFKLEIKAKINDLTMVFDNSIYLNAMKKEILNIIKDSNMNLNLLLKSVNTTTNKNIININI